MTTDKIILNKIDLISPKELAKLRQQVSEINCYATIMTCQFAKIDIHELLNIQAFDPKRFQDLYFKHDEKHGISNRSILIQRNADGKILNSKTKFSLSDTTKNVSKTPSEPVVTISLVTEEAIDLDLFNEWISKLLQENGSNIYRLKGILSVSGYDEQFVCHGIHMIFDGERSGKWPELANKRRSKLVVIGKDLDQEDWERGFSATLVQSNSTK
jgi:G3E family GTPase